jgi:hypothetical protein
LSFSQRISDSGEEDDDAEDDSDFSDGDNKRQVSKQRGRGPAAVSEDEDEDEDSDGSDDEWPAKRKRKPPARAARTTARQRMQAPSPPLVQLPPTPQSTAGSKRKRSQPTKLAPLAAAKVKAKSAAQSKRKPTSTKKKQQHASDSSDGSSHSVPDLDDGPFDCVLDFSQRDEPDSPPPLPAQTSAAKVQSPQLQLSQLDAAAAVVGTLTAIDGDVSEDANDDDQGDDEDVREVEAPIAAQSRPSVQRSSSMAGPSSADVRVPLFETADGGFRQLRDRRPRISYNAMENAMPMASQSKRK